MSTFGQIGAMLSRGAGKDRDIQDMPERIKNMEEFIRMTEKRKTELLEKCVEWISEHIADAEDRFEALAGRVGFTSEELHEFGVDDLDEFWVGELDYWKQVRESIKKEYATFKAEMSKDGVCAFHGAHEISVKTEFYCALIGDVEFDDKVYKALYNDRGNILSELYSVFIDKPGASVNSNAETEEFIEYYCEQYYPEIMNEEEEPHLQ